MDGRSEREECHISHVDGMSFTIASHVFKNGVLKRPGYRPSSSNAFRACNLITHTPFPSKYTPTVKIFLAPAAISLNVSLSYRSTDEV